MPHLYTIDHSRITGYLRNYDTIKQYICLLPYNDTSRPFIVTQEYLIHFDDFLLPCNIPTQIVKPLTVIKHLVFSPLDDKDKLYYTVLAKQSHSYNESLFISVKMISYMVQTEQKVEHKPPPFEHTSPIRNTPEKLSSVLNNRTIKDITHCRQLRVQIFDQTRTCIACNTSLMDTFGDHALSCSSSSDRISRHNSMTPETLFSMLADLLVCPPSSKLRVYQSPVVDALKIFLFQTGRTGHQLLCMLP